MGVKCSGRDKGTHLENLHTQIPDMTGTSASLLHHHTVLTTLSAYISLLGQYTSVHPKESLFPLCTNAFYYNYLYSNKQHYQ